MTREIPKTVLVGCVVTVVVLLALYIFTKLPGGSETEKIQSGGIQTQVSYTGGDRCATCHQRVTPDIVFQFAASTMAKSGVRCEDCHAVDKSNPMGHDHEGFFITSEPTPKQCERCHVRETNEYLHSRHAGPREEPLQHRKTPQFARLQTSGSRSLFFLSLSGCQCLT